MIDQAENTSNISGEAIFTASEDTFLFGEVNATISSGTITGKWKLEFDDSSNSEFVMQFTYDDIGDTLDGKLTAESLTTCANGSTSKGELRTTLKAIRNDRFEPNDTAETAAEITEDFQEPLVFVDDASGADEDWFRIVVSEDAIVTVDVTNKDEPSGGVRVSYEVMDMSLKPLFASTLLSDTTTRFIPEGNYLLRLTGSSSREDQSYDLAIDFKPVPDAAYEPNNLKTRASSIDLDFLQEMYLTQDDSDWLTFTLDENTLVDFESSVDDTLQFTLTNETTMLFDYEMGQNNEDSLKNIFLSKGTYFLNLAYAGSETYYNLRITKSEVADARFEPNNSYKEATPITLDFAEVAQVSTTIDKDWYKFSFGEATQVTLDVNTDATDAWFVTHFHDDINPRNIFSSAYTYPHVKVFAAGTYYLEVQGNMQEFEPFDYQIAMEGFSLENDIYEPNDGRGGATPIALGFTAENLNVSPGDEDWFKFSVDRTRDVTFWVDAHLESDRGDPISFTVLSSSLKSVRFIGEGKDTFRLPAGTYYFIATPQENAAAGGKYDFSYTIP